MFYGQCWKCGERWELGTASTCKCPEETTIDWKDYSIPVDKMKTLSIGNIKPNYNMTFHSDGKQIGVLDFNGPEMVFSGDMDESAKVFFDYVATAFKGRLEQERVDERNRTWTQEHWTEYEHSIVAGALFDFMGWLTSRKERIVLSSADNASPAVQAITEFAKMRGLSLDDAKVQDWQDSLRSNT